MISNRILNRLNPRSFSSIAFKTFGNPDSVISFVQQEEISKISDNQIKVDLKCCPVTTQDIMFLSGKSLVSNCGKNIVPAKPGTAGLIGFGTVASVGQNVKHVVANDSVLVSHTGTWTKSGVFRANRVKKCPSVAPEDISAFTYGLAAWGIMNSKPLKKGDNILHNLSEANLSNAISSIAKELGVSVTTSTEAKNVQMIITQSPAGGKLYKSLAPKGAMVVCSGSQETNALDSSIGVSSTSAIFEDISVLGFDLNSWIASVDDKTLNNAISQVHSLVKDKKISVKSKTFSLKDASAAVKAVLSGEGVAVLTI